MAYDQIPPGWIPTQATVTTCRYQSPGLSTLAFGFSTQRKFRITFNYYAHGRLYSGEFQSESAIPQNEQIPIAYDPLHPGQNTRAPASPPMSTSHPPLLLIGITGSIVLTLAWLLLLRGCH